eukprot:m.25774 g.25774  ORF g.25774 m.25774 type:complete len:280 (+) comp28958_c0_seq2:50-889(+)
MGEGFLMRHFFAVTAVVLTALVLVCQVSLFWWIYGIQAKLNHFERTSHDVLVRGIDVTFSQLMADTTRYRRNEKHQWPCPIGNLQCRGPPGPLGLPGPKGTKGPPGSKGEKGRQGSTEQKGQKGGAERDGVNGKRGGLHGLKGLKGEKGVKGDTGKVDPCSHYKTLAEKWRVVSSHSLHPRHCDKPYFAEGWYRFDESIGSKMPHVCPPISRCGGNGAGWIRGDHPTSKGKEVSRTVCFSYVSGCCVWKVDTRIINCGEFYIYYLKKVPSCDLTYCGDA